MSTQQVRTLSEQGHVIGCHTWDHHNITGYTGNDWKIQVEQPLHQLEKITGGPIKYFAYPYGAWNGAAINALKAYGFLGAFQLAGKQDTQNESFTIRRIIADGNWNEHQLLNAIKYSFK
jgi:peptidoglycan/xylan/chitin deacetylase (PgdA/CDA1 family)